MMKKSPPIKPISFRVRASPDERGSLYVHVNIWPTKKSMMAHDRLQGGNTASFSGHIILRFYPRGNGTFRRVKTGSLGEVNFHRGALGIGTVVHEFQHATLAWAERVNLNLSEVNDARAVHAIHPRGKNKRKFRSQLHPDSPEEQLCYVIGNLCRIFTKKAMDLGLYKETITAST